MIFDILLILTMFIMIVLSISLFKKASYSLNPTKLTITSFIFYKEIVPCVYIGTFLVGAGLTGKYYLAHFLSKETAQLGAIVILASAIVLPLIIILTNYVIKKQSGKSVPEQIKNYLNSQLEGDASATSEKTIMIIFSCIAVASYLYILVYSPGYPFLTALLGDANAARVERITVNTNFRGIIYIKNLICIYFTQVIGYYSIIQLKRYRTKFYLANVVVINVCVALILTFSNEKFPIINYLLGLLVVSSLLKCRLKLRKLIVFVSVLVVMIGIAYIITMGNSISQILAINGPVSTRVFLSQIYGCFLSFELFPNIITQNTTWAGMPGFLLRALQLPGGEESPRLLKMYTEPQSVEAGTAGVMNSYFMGEAWTNFSYVGLIIAPIIVAVLMNLANVWLFKNKKTPLNIAFYAFFSIRMAVTGGFIDFFYLKYWIYFLIILVFARLIVYFVKRIRKECTPSLFKSLL